MPFKTKLNNKTKEMEIIEKFPKFFLADTEDTAVELMKSFEYIINLLAHKYSKVTGLSEDDLKQEGIIGLARANRDFDVERSKQFKVFAIYKIKDALNEYVADQSLDISMPQYLVNATRLITKMYNFLLMFSLDMNGSYIDIWNKGNAFTEQENIESLINDENRELIQNAKHELDKIINSINSLAERSMTTVEQLLKRAEMLPNMNSNENCFDTYSEETHSAAFESSEMSMLNSITTAVLIDKIKKSLSKEDYELLVAHYVEGRTLRELEETVGIKAPSIAVKIHKIMETVRKKVIKV